MTGWRDPVLFDAVLADAGIKVVRSGIQIPRMNAVMRRWVRTCRRELLDRTLIYNQRHLLLALRECEIFYDTHRPHQGIANARPLVPLPEPIIDPDRLAHLNIHRRDRLSGILREYEHAACLPGRHSRQVQGSRLGADRGGRGGFGVLRVIRYPGGS